MAQRLLNNLGVTYLWYGGWGDAERKLCGLFPKGQLAQTDSFPIAAFCARLPKGSTLCHRDFLGALLALGLKRDAVGDILVEGQTAYLFLLQSVSGLVAAELQKVGNAGISLTACSADEISYERRYEQSTLTLSSLRLDCVVAALQNCSRAKAEELIVSGKVKLCGIEEGKLTRMVRDKDTVSIRGLGRFILETDGALTKKGRARVCIKRYV